MCPHDLVGLLTSLLPGAAEALARRLRLTAAVLQAGSCGQQPRAVQASALPHKALVEGRQRLVDRSARNLRRPVVREDRCHVHSRPDAVTDRPGPHPVEGALGGRHGLPGVPAERGHLCFGLRTMHTAPTRAPAWAGARQLELGLGQLPRAGEQERALQLAVTSDEAQAQALRLELAAVQPFKGGLVLAEVAQDEHHHRQQIRQASVAVVALQSHDRRLQPRERFARTAPRRFDPHQRERIGVREASRPFRVGPEPLCKRLGLIDEASRGERDDLVPGNACGGLAGRRVGHGLPALHDLGHFLEGTDGQQGVDEEQPGDPVPPFVAGKAESRRSRLERV